MIPDLDSLRKLYGVYDTNMEPKIVRLYKAHQNLNKHSYILSKNKMYPLFLSKSQRMHFSISVNIPFL